MSVLYQWPLPDWSSGELLVVCVAVVVTLLIIAGLLASILKDANDWSMSRPSWLRRALRRLLATRYKKSGSPEEVTGGDGAQHFNFTELKRHVKQIEGRVEALEVIKSELKITVREELISLLRNDPGVGRMLELSLGGDRPTQDPARRPGEGRPSHAGPAHFAGGADARKSLTSQQGAQHGTPQRKYIEMRDFYNESLTDQARRAEFRERFRPVTISVVNAVERRRDENAEPVYQTSTDGNFLAVSLDSGGEYAVFPNFGVALEASSHGEGAMGEVFRCGERDEFDRRYSYPNIRVEAPAIFAKTGDGGWELNTKGVLNLGRPEEI